MSVYYTLLDYGRQALDLIVSAAGFIIKKTGEYTLIAWEWFRGLPFPEELIIINGIPALCAVLFPAARFYIFEFWYEVNNPLAVWMIVIGFVMFATVFFREKVWVAPARIGVNLYYLGWAIYMVAGNQITKADSYEITGFYAFNYIVPVVYASLSALSFVWDRRR
ncbi:MAG: hypothetical protein ACRCUT_02545 [Spirochaetota bacterium]